VDVAVVAAVVAGVRHKVESAVNVQIAAKQHPVKHARNAMATPSERIARPVANAESAAIVVREANVASAEKMRMAATPQRMPKMSAPRAWRQTRLSNAQKLAQRERRVARADASVAKDAANAVSAVARILKIWRQLKLS